MSTLRFSIASAKSFALAASLSIAACVAGLVHATDLDEGTLILVAKPKVHDGLYGSSILIAKPVGNDRHVGFILNRPTQVTLGRLFPEHAASHKVPDPIYLGGPFNTEFIFALVQRGDSPGGRSIQMTQDLYLATDAPTVDRIIEGEAAHARFLAGLVAWRPGELREELKRGLWYVLEADTDLVMRRPTEGLWEELVKRLERRANTL